MDDLDLTTRGPTVSPHAPVDIRRAMRVNGIPDAGTGRKDRGLDRQLEIEPERFGDGFDEQQRRVRLPALDAPDVARRHADSLGECLAAHVQAEAGIEACSTESDPDRHTRS